VICVLVVGSGAAWESGALTTLTSRPDVTVLKRCVDVNDLLAAATLGQADVAVVGLDAPGLDAAAVEHLRRHRVRVVGVVDPAASPEGARAHAHRIGVRALVPAGSGEALLATVLAPPSSDAPTAPRGPRIPAPDQGVPGHGAPGHGAPGPGVAGHDAPTRPGPDHGLPGLPALPGQPDGPVPDPPPTGGRVVAVWGPAGAPGRTTVATGVAAALARRGRPTLLVDADPWGGTVAQALGVLDDVSGLLAAARAHAAGDLETGWPGLVRQVERHLQILTGLPRPDRWAEVGPEVLEVLLPAAAGAGDVVVDTGFGIEGDEAADLAGRPVRDASTQVALQIADVVAVVGTADPVGLTRLARGLSDLRELEVAAPVHVVVNRMRPTLGWSEAQVRAMLVDLAHPAAVHVLPDDVGACDRALVTGRHLLDVGDGPLARAVRGLADALAPVPGGPGGPPTTRRRLRRAGRQRRGQEANSR
jgi:Mrp family chromosome partitioning ATPase